VYQAMPLPMSSSLGGYFCCNWVTWDDVNPLSRFVLRSSTTSSTWSRKGCFLVSAAMMGGNDEFVENP